MDTLPRVNSLDSARYPFVGANDEGNTYSNTIYISARPMYKPRNSTVPRIIDQRLVCQLCEHVVVTAAFDTEPPLVDARLGEQTVERNKNKTTDVQHGTLTNLWRFAES
jgi:hypothetical protein